MYGVYGIIYSTKNKYLVAKYDSGLELVGGRIDNNETFKEAFFRELEEEIGLTKKDVNKIKLLDKKQVFESKRSSGFEIHTFFIVKLNETAEPIKREIDFEWWTREEMFKLTLYKDRQKIINFALGEIEKDER